MKAAVVTGASSGIGEATARRLDRDGWSTLLVARREDRLNALAASLGGASVLAVDLVEEDAPVQVAKAVEERFGRLDLLVNNAGSAWRTGFGEEGGGFENVRRTMELNFFAPVRLTEALLPVLRRSAPSAVVNVGSISGRVAMPRTGGYSASKFALVGWTEALHFEESEHGVHVGLVQPGFIATEGFPQSDIKARRATSWMVSTPERVAEAVLAVGPGRRPERAVPPGYGAVMPFRALAPAIWRRVARSVRS